MKKFYLLLIAVLPVITAQSQNNDWIGASGSDWATGTNWNLGHAPTATENAVFNGFNGTVLFSANVTDVQGINVTNGSVVTFQSPNSATAITIGVTTFPTLTVDATSTLRARTGNTTAVTGGIILKISGSSTVAAGGTIDLLSGSSTVVNVNNSGSLVVNGTFKSENELITGTTYSNAGFITITSGTVSFGPNALAYINRTGGMGTIPFASWDATSTLHVTNITGTTVAAPSWAGAVPHELGNFIFDCPALGPGSYSLALTSGATVTRFKGFVEIRNTNGKAFSFSTLNSINQTVTFDDNLLIGVGAGNTVSDFRAINNVTGGAAVVTWNCKKNVQITPAIDFTGSALTTHSLNLTGAVMQTLTLTGGNKSNSSPAGGLMSVTVNNGGNGATLGAGTGNLKNLSLLNGKLLLGNYNAITGYNAGTVTGGAGTGWVVCNGTGNLTVVNLPAASSTLFPVGISTTSYDPVRLNPTSPADFAVSVKDATGGFTNPESNPSLTCNREWNIATGGAPGSTLAEFEPDAASSGCPVSGTKVVGHYSGGAWSETSSAAGPNFSYSASFTSFSPFGVGTQGGFSCPTANAGTVSGTSPLCIGTTDTYLSNGDPGGTWSSTDNSVASVNPSTGFVTALSAGATNITYTINNGCSSASSFKTLTVNPNVSAGTVSGTSPLCISATDTYTSNGATGGAWSSTNPSVATVNSLTGAVTALAPGTTDITYTVNSGCGSPVSSFKTLTVGSSVNAGTISGTSPLFPGSTSTYTSNGDPGGSWSSSNPAAATVDPATGLVTAVASGTTNITYTLNSGCGAPTSSFKTLTVTTQNRWVGPSGGNWNNPSNWSLGIIPASGHDVLFDAFSGTVNFPTITPPSTQHVAPVASFTATNATNLVLQDVDNGNDTIGSLLSPTVLTITGNSTVRSKTIPGVNGAGTTGGVQFVITGSSSVAAGSTLDFYSGSTPKVVMLGGTFQVDGTILCQSETTTVTSNAGFITRTNGNLNFGPLAWVEFNRPAGVGLSIPYASWASGSTMRITNCTATTSSVSWATPPVGQYHSLGNLVIDCPLLGAAVFNLGFTNSTATLVNEIKGDFTVNNANGKVITFMSISSGASSFSPTISFRGNVTFSNTAELRAFNYTGTGTGNGTATWNFEKNVSLPVVGISINTSTAHTMNFTGPTPQNLSLGGYTSGGIFSLVVNNGGNGVTLASSVGNLKNVTLTNGKLTLGNFNLTAGYNGGTISASPGNWIVTNSSGTLTINNVTTGHTFPIGNSKYNPLVIQNGSGHNWSVRASDGLTADPGFTTDKAVLVTWDITPSVNPPAAGADITFQFDEATQTGPLFSTALNVQAWRRPAGAWMASGSAAPVLGVAGARTVKVTGLTGFSAYGLSNSGSPLPVDLVYFSGQRVSNNSNLLRWTTLTETNNRGFEIQRSVDGISYSPIGDVPSLAPNGNSSIPLSYQFTDPGATGKQLYYRLRQTDLDGHSKFSNIVLIKGELLSLPAIDRLFPNPVSEQLHIIFNSPAASSYRVMIMDLSGRIASTQLFSAGAGSNTLKMDVRSLASGIYLLYIPGAGTTRFVKE